MEWKFAEGLSELKRAKELSPTNPTANDLLARVIVYLGRIDEAERQARQAVELDPLVCYNAIQPGASSFLLRENWMRQTRLRAKWQSCSRLLLPVIDGRCSIAVQRGDGETALREAQLEPDDGFRRFELALAQYVRGDRKAADAALADLIANARDGFAYQIAAGLRRAR